MKRNVGYYWIRRGTTWEIGYFTGRYWNVLGNDFNYTDFDLKEIDEKRIIRDLDGQTFDAQSC